MLEISDFMVSTNPSSNTSATVYGEFSFSDKFLSFILVSFGAFTILMFLIKAGSVSKTSTLFFLVPPTTAVMAYLFLGEKLSNVDITGFILATIGVYIATRK